MGYKIVDPKDAHINWNRGGEVEFTSDTRAGLNEEIERFVKKEKPEWMDGISGHLVPQYYEKQWHLRMHSSEVKPVHPQ